MSDPVHSRRIPVPPAEGSEKLLGILSADRAKALQRYDKLRLRLLKFFQWERCPAPRERVEEAMIRIERMLLEGAEMMSPEAEFLGVARAIARDVTAAPRRSPRNAPPPPPEPPESAVEHELREALTYLTPAQREIVTRCFHPDMRTREENRRDMAARLSYQAADLREHALDLRESLEEHVRQNSG